MHTIAKNCKTAFKWFLFWNLLFQLFKFEVKTQVLNPCKKCIYKKSTLKYDETIHKVLSLISQNMLQNDFINQAMLKINRVQQF